MGFKYGFTCVSKQRSSGYPNSTRPQVRARRTADFRTNVLRLPQTSALCFHPSKPTCTRSRLNNQWRLWRGLSAIAAETEPPRNAAAHLHP